ncbi:thioredoxin-domain-containing protein [Desarmillaria tabescens]|uniref:Thioredoxin-domain-containing protein n=1 Tax=Armillaria tabescens TaxID=1929756 RepID=A0AA39NKG9_ARMTA|nr:thioredoxin-domain-containing protein [Desarmillaria tabescens]KAK0467252.1 thioredoxin-domain-containing protein [Desarmillaria tabescens]
MSGPVEIESVTQWNETLRSATAAGQTVFVDFHAVWCGPCKQIAPFFAQFVQKNPQAIFVRVDVDAQKAISSKYRISAMPTFIAIKAGKQVDFLQGADPRGLAAMITRHAARVVPLSAEAEAAKEEGNKHFASGEYTAAAEAYTTAISHAQKSPQLYANRALAYLRLGGKENLPKALADAVKATELDERWGKGWARLGDVMLAVGEDETDPEGVKHMVNAAQESFENAVGLLEGSASQQTGQ